MTNANITIMEREIQAGEDRFAVLIDGVVFTSHSRRSGAEKIAARLATGWRGE